jgi:thymidylate synthase (FAD)
MTIDPYFKVKLIAATPNPNQVVWYAMHQDYSEGFVGNEDPPSEAVAGEIAIKRLLAGNRGTLECLNIHRLRLMQDGFLIR